MIAIVAMFGFVHLVAQIAPPRTQIVQQFYVMKGVIAASKFTKTIIVSIGVGAYASDPERYNDEVMSHGVGCFVSLMLMPFVAIACRKYYVVVDGPSKNETVQMDHFVYTLPVLPQTHSFLPLPVVLHVPSAEAVRRAMNDHRDDAAHTYAVYTKWKWGRPPTQDRLPEL